MKGSWYDILPIFIRIFSFTSLSYLIEPKSEKGLHESIQEGLHSNTMKHYGH